MSYHTKQQRAVLHCLEARRDEALSTADLARDLQAEGCPVGLATIYRQVEKLSEAGVIHKLNTSEGAVYQYCGHEDGGHRECVLFQCEQCGRICHMDCAELEKLYAHLESAHHFHINPYRTLFSGLCDVCARKEEDHHESH